MRNSSDKALSLIAEADQLCSLKKYSEAEIKTREAIIFYEKENLKTSEYAQCLLTFAQIAIRQQKANNAITYADKARKIFERIFPKDHYQSYFCLSTIGNGNLLLKNYSLAELQLTEASKGIKKTFGVESIHYLHSLQNIAYLFINQNKTPNAESVLIEIMDIYLAILKNNFQLMNSEERLAFIDGLAVHHLLIYNYLANHNNHSSAFVKKTFVFRLNLKWTLIEGLEKFIVSETIFKDICKVLKDEEAVIEIVRFHELEYTESENIYYLFFIITAAKKDSPVIITVKNGLELEGDLFNDYQTAIKHKSIDFSSYDIYWKMINDQIPDKKKIYISADGIYRRINIDTLFTDKGKYLFDDKEIIQCHDLRNFSCNNVKTNEYPKNALLLANPLFYNSDIYERDKTIEEFLPPIPSSENEIENVSQILKQNGWTVKQYIKQEVTKDKFDNMEQIGLLHIATHGIFREPLIKIYSTDELIFNSGLFLSNPFIYSVEKKDIVLDRNGYLDGKDILKMDLSNVELAVLSGCESGKGAMLNLGETFGFERTFFIAGVKAIIMSLWKVEDEVTKDLMVSFYNNWVISGDKFSSFRKAQEEIKQKHRQPLYWAGFVLIRC